MASLPKKWRTPRKTKVFLIPSLYNPLAKARGPGRHPAGVCSPLFLLFLMSPSDMLAVISHKRSSP